MFSAGIKLHCFFWHKICFSSQRTTIPVFRSSVPQIHLEVELKGLLEHVLSSASCSQFTLSLHLGVISWTLPRPLFSWVDKIYWCTSGDTIISWSIWGLWFPSTTCNSDPAHSSNWVKLGSWSYNRWDFFIHLLLIYFIFIDESMESFVWHFLYYSNICYLLTVIMRLSSGEDLPFLVFINLILIRYYHHNGVSFSSRLIVLFQKALCTEGWKSFVSGWLSVPFNACFFQLVNKLLQL